MTMTPFDRMLDSTLYVAAARARREGRPMAVEQGPVAWTVRDADRPTPPDHERIAVARPEDHSEEARMSIAKRVYLARVQGRHIAAPVLRLLGGEPAAAPLPLFGDALPGAVNAHEIAERFGETKRTPYTTSNDPLRMFDDLPVPAEIVTPACEASRETRRERALRGRSCAPPRPSRIAGIDGPGRIGPGVPKAVREALARSLATLQEYRHQIQLVRAAGKKYGGGRRYLDDVRINLAAMLRRALPPIRDFVRRAPANGVDPYRFLRAIAAERPRAEGPDEATPEAPPEPQPEPAKKDRWAIIGQPGSRIEVVDGQSVIVPPGRAAQAGPYGTAAAPTRPRRGKKAPAPGQGSLFD